MYFISHISCSFNEKDFAHAELAGSALSLHALGKSGIACVKTYPQRDTKVIKYNSHYYAVIFRKRRKPFLLTTTLVSCFNVIQLADCVLGPFFHFSQTQVTNEKTDGKSLHCAKTFFSYPNKLLPTYLYAIASNEWNYSDVPILNQKKSRTITMMKKIHTWMYAECVTN